MKFLKRIFIADERLRHANADLETKVRELQTELDKRDCRIAVLEDQNELLANVNAFNHRHIEDVLGSSLSSQNQNGFTSEQTENGTPARY